MLELCMHHIDRHPPVELLRRTLLTTYLARVQVRINGAVEPRIPFLEKLLERCTGAARLAYRAEVEKALEKAREEKRAAHIEALIEGRF